jgi:hypothetical protein
MVDTIISPKEAFESIRETPTWGWALLIAIVLAAAGSYFTTPAVVHVITTNPASLFGAQAATMTPDDMAKAAGFAAKFSAYNFIFVIIIFPIVCLIESLIMLLFNALGKGEGNFVKYFAAQCNIAVIAALGAIVNAVIVTVRGSDSFNTMRDVQFAVPSLAMLAPGGGAKLITFLGIITPFSLWATGLAIFAMLTIGRVPKLQAWLTGAVLLLVPALLAAAFAK